MGATFGRGSRAPRRVYTWGIALNASVKDIARARASFSRAQALINGVFTTT
jgi:hypothetical protein